MVDDVERRQMALLRELTSDSASGVRRDVGASARPELRALERLFFECYARGAQGESPFTTMLPAAVERWLTEVQTHSPTDPAAARLGLAVMRGLLLDLAGTNDDPGVDAAAQLFVDLLVARETGSG